MPMLIMQQKKTWLKDCDLGMQVIGHAAVCTAPDSSSKLVIRFTHILNGITPGN